MKTFFKAPFVYELMGISVEVHDNAVVDVQDVKIYGPNFKNGMRTTIQLGFIPDSWQEVKTHG